ncbi:MAG: hypothetical protein MUF04_06140 [Akkermansiaceae bacterium]|nr:hypothetical protein [Akkermansiaceae bacterium]
MPSPFQPVAKSPFTLVPDDNGSGPVEPGRPAKIPERRPRGESPFQLASEISADATAAAAAGFPTFEAAQPSPFALASGAAPPYAAAAGFADAPAAAPYPAWQQPAYAAPQPVATPFAPAPATPAAQGFIEERTDSSFIRQIELRAIFGVDREMSHEEIMQRARALPGIRHLALVDAAHVGALEGLRQILASLGFGTGGLRIYCGSSPVEFIREGSVILAVQTDGGFAPGIRETLMLVARELGR